MEGKDLEGLRTPQNARGRANSRANEPPEKITEVEQLEFDGAQSFASRRNSQSCSLSRTKGTLAARTQRGCLS